MVRTRRDNEVESRKKKNVEKKISRAESKSEAG